MTDLKKPWVAVGVLVALAVAVSAMFNLRLGFGAQEIDCIDSHINITRLETPSKVEQGDLVVFIAPKQLGENIAGHLVIKKVGAVAGDRIQIEKGMLYINDVKVGPLDVADKAAIRMNVSVDSFSRSEVVPEGFVFAIGTKPRTFDSRYWGMLPVSSIVGSAFPVI